MQLNAELVVLSACESGTGKYVREEGVMSLARGLMTAGAASLVMSLWKVEDQADADLMKGFYAQLAEGASKSEALRQAKLAYLDSADGLTAHPAFWAAFVSIGDHRALPQNNSGKGFALLSVLMLGIGAWGWGKEKKAKQKG